MGWIFIEKARNYGDAFPCRHQLTEILGVQPDPRAKSPRQPELEGSLESLDRSLCGTRRPMLKIQEAQLDVAADGSLDCPSSLSI